MKILITGGAGFIGANVAASYLKRGHSVTVYDNFSRKGTEKNIDWLQTLGATKLLKVVEGDVADFSSLKQLVKKQDIVFHLAGQTAVTTSIKNPRLDFEANALGTFNVLEAVRQSNPETVVFYSSTNKVYGAMSRVNTRRRGKRYYGVQSASVDESESLDFYSPYGCSKGAGDQYMQDYSRIYGLKTVVFRQSCIYGSHQFGVEDQGWVAHFTSQVIKNKKLKIFGDGKQVRDLLYITDLVRAFRLAHKYIHITAGQVYNIGGGITNSISLLELIEQLEELSKRTVEVEYFEARKGDQRVYISDTAKAYRDFNWQPKVSVTDGIEKLYQWLESFHGVSTK